VDRSGQQNAGNRELENFGSLAHGAVLERGLKLDARSTKLSERANCHSWKRSFVSYLYQTRNEPVAD
jgi:hypothetical protein